jgi:transposase-like protein
MFTLDLDEFPGGVALWGAVPAIYDTTRFQMDRGMHVHARTTPGVTKAVDATYRAVRLLGKSLPREGILLNENDAIYYVVTSVFGSPMRYVECTHCGWPHLDKDWFSVHPHQRHLCAGCGKNFRDSVRAIGNPIVGIRDACGAIEHKTVRSKRKLTMLQGEFLGGIQIWGSNPALLWTSDRAEEEGIHIHAYLEGANHPELDETYGEVTIDGVRLDPELVRVLMVQSVMPALKGRIRSMDCPRCTRPHRSLGEAAYTPAVTHTCASCHHEFSTAGRLRNTVVNPLVVILEQLAKDAPRPPQQLRLDLLPETL